MKLSSVKGKDRPVTEATLGLWLNADTLRSVEIVAPHVRKSIDGGWVAEIESAGQLVITTRDGERQVIEVSVGDRMTKSCGEFDIAVKRTRKG